MLSGLSLRIADQHIQQGRETYKSRLNDDEALHLGRPTLLKLHSSSRVMSSMGEELA